MDIVYFKDIGHEEWDRYVALVPESTYRHTSWWLNYLNAIYGLEGCKSFVVMQGKDPQAICPVFVSEASIAELKFWEGTRNGMPSVYPAFIDLPSTQRRRLVRKTFAFIEEMLKSYPIKRIEFCRHPMNQALLQQTANAMNMTEAVAYGYFPFIQNTIMMDLSKSEEQLLSEMGMYQRKRIRKAFKQNLKFKEYCQNSPLVDQVFAGFQAAHFKSAGKMTRSQASWDCMKQLIKEAKASLFVVSVEGIGDISYLYCGEFHGFAFGWSQVNLDEFERQYSPRHFLEWSAMMAYQKRGFKYYEVGAKFGLPQLNYIPSEKETSIANFKERYGGHWSSVFFMEKFFERQVFSAMYHQRVDAINASNYFDQLQEALEED